MITIVSRYSLHLCLVLSLFGCGESNSVKPGEATLAKADAAASDSPEVILFATKSLYNGAKQKDHAWIATSREIAVAEKALEAGDLAAARQAALRAQLTAQASLAQANLESQAWRTRVP
ncbi:MAG TPA: hypothetical protein EYQ22_10410 [Gammaproteobacteria bacterium]|nr:hypothetical protein [Gammaproteobacteria bacterium]HIK71621.1 hypothetical protein [Pseudomonadales bacterium]